MSMLYLYTEVMFDASLGVGSLYPPVSYLINFFISALSFFLVSRSSHARNTTI